MPVSKKSPAKKSPAKKPLLKLTPAKRAQLAKVLLGLVAAGGLGAAAYKNQDTINEYGSKARNDGMAKFDNTKKALSDMTASYRR